MKRVLRILLAVLFIAAVGGGYVYYRSRAAGGATSNSASATTYTQVIQVTQGDLNSTLSVVGQLAAEQSAALNFEHLSGTTELATVSIAAGAVVTKGQVLATINDAAYRLTLEQARSDLQAAEETLADLQAPPTALEIAQADVTVASAEQMLQQAKSDLADLGDADLTALENAVKDAQDGLTLLQIQSEQAQRDSLAKSERDLQYSVHWYERRVEQLKALQNPTAEQTAELAVDEVTLAEARVDLAGVQSQRELARQSREAELAQKQLALAEAQAALAEARAGGDKLSLAQAQLAVSQAEVSLQSAQIARTELEEGADATKLAAAQAAVDKKKLAVSNAEIALAGTQLVAPFDGTILEVNAGEGDRVSASSRILTLANLKTLQVVASVDETTIRQVSTGQDATITFDAFPGQSFSGKVLAVPLQGTLQGDVMTYSVPVSLSGAEKLTLLVGMTANVEIQVGTVTNALLVPTMALTQSNNMYQVLVPNTTDPTGSPEAVPVEIGLSNGTYTVVTRGLNVGDKVLVQLDTSGSSTRSTRSTRIGGGVMGGLGGMFGGR